MKVSDVRTLNLSDLKIRDAENGLKKIEGYALKFNEPSEDLGGFVEYVTPEALSNVSFENLLLIYAHDYNNILARADSDTLTVQVDNVGLHFEATLANTTLANDVYNDILAGNLKGCSFGFVISPGGDDWSETSEGMPLHIITNIQSISELTITPIPAYTETSVTVTRSLDKIKERMKMTDEEKKKMEEEKREKERLEREKAIEEEKRAAEKKKQEERESKEKAEEEKREKKTQETIKREMEKIRQEFADKNKGGDVKLRELGKKADEQKRDFHKMLVAGEIKRDTTSTNMVLSDGSVLIPDTILPAEHEEHQFPRLGNLVRNVQVKTTTGKLPIFQTSDDVLEKHDEFGTGNRKKVPDIKPVPWDLGSFSSTFAYSQELLTDSQYNWESELGDRLIELRDNTDDSLIITALTAGLTATVSTDLIADIKKALNLNLKPVDSQKAQIVMSQAAFDAIDQLKDDMGRPLIQMDLTKASNYTLLGKQLVVIADTLFPSAKAGDVNIIVSPLQKSVIKFKNAEITGKFIDSYDVFYRLLGIFVREDVVQARKDLIQWITKTAA
ncbi:phage major capsid protein [Liquorilactobacillus cacaonum]|uniref:Phage capsid protein n=1 Tax=Liquorilactobacillus cacaonum DSM 21116 TaxID=1423729 RepID=A0A0R2CK44_9LACO|nr:phage major capsid protein [Liquorilactobacillus cacaonum]KRM91490.1 phage capsid protein [Liquorilactobacillus cacaonum DSM 21116]